MTTWADEPGYITLLDDCEKREERLNDWERGFVDSLRRQIEEAAGRRRNRTGLRASSVCAQVWAPVLDSPRPQSCAQCARCPKRG